MGRTLGPFPKTLRWREIVTRSIAPDRLPVAPEIAEATLNQLQASYEALAKDEAALKAVTFLVALPVSTRSAHPVEAMHRDFGIELEGDVGVDNLVASLQRYEVSGCLPTVAAEATIRDFVSAHEAKALFETDQWRVWRDADGSAFCDLAKLFFTHLNEQYFGVLLATAGAAADPGELRVFSDEMAVITRAFSARWFNACARYQVPETGSIRWYLGHCLGKLDLELCREQADWVEPTGNPWKRRKKAEASLGI